MNNHMDDKLNHPIVLVHCDLSYEVGPHEWQAIKQNERLLLLEQSSEEWWLVTRDFEENDQTRASNTAPPSSNLCESFFVPTSYIRLLNEREDAEDLKSVANEFDSKVSDEANCSSRDSLDVLELDDSSRVCSFAQCHLSMATCDSQQYSCQKEPPIEDIYAEPCVGPMKAMPRKAVPRPEPEYANICDLTGKPTENRESTKFSTKQKPPSLSEGNGSIMKRRLFDGWSEYEDKSGRQFYLNSINGATSWKPPRRLTSKVDLEFGCPAGDSAANHKLDGEGRKFSLDSSLVLARDEADYVELKSCQSTEESTMESQQAAVMKEQSTQTDFNSTMQLPAGYRLVMNPLTRDFFLMGQDGQKWFCKRDDNGQMFFYEDGQGMLGISELPSFDEEPPVSHKDRDKMRSPKSGHRLLLPIRTHDQALQVNLNVDRNVKAQRHSVALIPSRALNNNSDMIIFKEQFKHTSPFQNVSVIIPSPPTSLNMKDIIYSGTLNRTRTVVSGKVSKRKNWGTSYLVLTKYYLLFFKDQKSAFATSSPIKTEFVLGLLNASIDWCPNKSSRKNAFQVSTFQDQILLQDDKNDLSAKWFASIRDAIMKLPSPLQMAGANVMSSSITEGLNDKSAPLKLKRSRSTKQYRQQEEFPPMSSNKHATLSGYATIANAPMNDKKVKIRERLRQFLRKRPTMENLREKGIIKAENVFGRNLEELCTRDQVPIPKFVTQCVEAIEFKDLKADGIYRACGNLSTVQKLRFEINQDNYTGLWKEEDVHVMTGLLKMFFREMPEPLFPCDRFENLMKFMAIKNKDTKMDSFRNLVHNLPVNNYHTLACILKHLLRITEHSSDNRMSVQNLAIVFGPTLIRPMSDLNNLVLDMMIQMQQSQVIEFLLLEYRNLFNDESS